MSILVLEILILLILRVCCSRCADDVDDNVLKEGHMIRKRFAALGYHGYDTAFTSHDLGGDRYRRSANRNTTQALQDGHQMIIVLNMTSGTSLRIKLKHAPVVDAETEVVYLKGDGSVRRKTELAGNCLAHGQVEGGGLASVSFCNGLFGLVSHDGFHYLVHPVESRRSKRDVKNRSGSTVHVVWRRSTPDDDVFGLEDDVLYDEDGQDVRKYVKVRTKSRSMSNKLVIELATFSDAKYCELLKKHFPGREDEFLLTRIAAAQALYSDHGKVGYDVQIKVKLMEYWYVDPEEYDFQEDIGNNLKSFCAYTKTRYFYDVHGLNTGITHQKDRKIGLAYMNGACRKSRCFAALPVKPNSFGVIAHEIGHTLGFSHPDQNKCPPELETGSFMGGGASFDFSKCKKWDLERFLEKGGDCLFEENSESKTPEEYQNLLSAFPGQIKSPDELCRLQSGPGYVYFPPVPTTGVEVCKNWYCINNNEESWEYGRVKFRTLPKGFPCGDDMFCLTVKQCIPLDSPNIAFSVEKLKEVEGVSEWSSWSQNWTPCSRECGTGVELRQRACWKEGVNLKPYCQGETFKARLCNKQPCKGDDSKTETMITQTHADEVCKRFVDNDSHSASSFLPKAIILSNVRSLAILASPSCMLKCEKIDKSRNSKSPDAILPDGSTCLDSQRKDFDLKRLGIELRCVQGRCVEFSDCPDDLSKDTCGICGGDESRCVTKLINSSYDVADFHRSVLATIEPNSSYIDVRMKWGENLYVGLELWSADGICIIGKNGIYTQAAYDEDKPVQYAGASWTFNRKGAFLTAKGPIDKAVEIRAHRAKHPIKKITIRYARPKP